MLCRGEFSPVSDYEQSFVATPDTARSQYSPAVRWLMRLIPQGARSQFLANVVKLSSATGFGIVISVAAAPWLTRLYQPADFGVLSVYTSVFYMLVALASLRYDYALPIPKRESSAVNLLAVCGLLLVLTTATLSCLTWTCGADLAVWLGYPEMLPVLWLLPCGFLAVGIYQVLNYWSVRQKAYTGLARSNVARSGTESMAQIGMGIAAFGPVGLILGVVGGYVVAAISLLHSTWRRDDQILQSVNRREMYHVARRYRSYPMFAAAASLLNGAGLRMPPLILAVCYGPVVVGWFALSQRVLGLPMRLVGKSISDVYFGEVAQCVRDRPGDLPGMFYRSAVRLSILALPLLLFAVVAPTVFAVAFGSAWRSAGEYCRLLVACYSVGFIVISISQLTTYGFNHWQLAWDALRLVATTPPLLLAHHWGCSAATAIAWYAFAATASYILLFGLNMLAIRRVVAGARSAEHVPRNAGPGEPSDR